MEYDPIKQTLGKLFKRNLFFLSLFYFLLDLLFLRTWYIHREIKRFAKTRSNNNIIKVLDAGSGFGQYSWYIARKYKNWEVKGIDIKATEIKECQEFFRKAGLINTSFEVQDLTNYTSPSDYDLVLSVDVLEHIFEDVTVLKNAFESLKLGGILLISTPSDQGGSDIHHENDESFISEHVREGYSVDDISLKLKIAGFKKIQAKYSYGVAGSLSWKISVKYPISMLNFSKGLIVLLPLYYLIFGPLCYLLNLIDVKMNNKKGTGLIVVAEKAL